MKKSLFLALCLLMALGAAAEDITICSYNIRNRNNGDPKNGDGWSQRSAVLCEQLYFEDPDLFGMQEVVKAQLDDVLRMLPDYAAAGVGREDGKEAGEYSPVLYKKERFRLLDSGTFWLSETPDRPSMGWDAACKRVCSWVYLKDKRTGRKLYYFNTHLDHIGTTARREGAALIVKFIREHVAKGEYAAVTGDFNVTEGSEPYRTIDGSGLLRDCYELAPRRFAPNGTFVDFRPSLYSSHRIDHIFVTTNFHVMRYAVRTDRYWHDGNHSLEVQATGKGRENPEKTMEPHTISDHYPVVVKLNY